MNSPTKNKRIAIVAHHYPPHITGVGVVAQNHARRLASLGHSVTVITSRTNPDEKSYNEGGVNVVRVAALNFSESWGAPFPIFSPSLIPALFSQIKQADIVHIHDAFYMSSFCAAVIAKILGKPIFLTQHVAMIAHPSKVIVLTQKLVYATTGALIFTFAKVIFTFNDRVEQFLIDRGVPQSKIAQLPNGVDTDLFHPATDAEKKVIRQKFGLDADKKIILFVGRFVPKKGFDKVLGARSADYQIVCAGGEMPKEHFDNIVFLGKMDQQALSQIYQAADIFLLPSESEGFPLSVQEAMASGLPIITTNDKGYHRYGLDDQKVSLIERPDETSVRNAIRAIIGDEVKLKAMGIYSRTYTENNFSWPLIIRRLDHFYEGPTAQRMQ